MDTLVVGVAEAVVFCVPVTDSGLFSSTGAGSLAA